MKNIETTVTLVNGTPTVSRKNYNNSTYLSVGTRVVVREKGITPRDSCNAYIFVSKSLKAELGDKYFTIINPVNGAFADVTVYANEKLEANQVDVTKYVTKTLGIDIGSEIVICRQNYRLYNNVKLQTFAKIKDDIVVLPKDAFLENMAKEFQLFEVINPLTNDSIFVRSKHIEFEETLGPQEIRLNKKQRNMLSDNIPTRLSAEQYEELLKSETVNREKLNAAYKQDLNGYTIAKAVDELDYPTRSAVQKYIKAAFGESVIVRPVIESFHYEKKKALYRKLSDFFVGKSTLSLNCRRPHECDENSDVVRMSESNMLFLGIEPMDRVVIRYKETEVTCHVLPFSNDKFERTNIPSIIELSIGIPAHIRDKLKITDIQSSVKVDRDTPFIFKKSFNDQLVPIILTLLSLKFFEQLPWYISLALMVVLVPVVMYVTLSSKRNMRGR